MSGAARPGWPSCAIPSLPPARGYESSGRTELHPRYEDVTQDGRVVLTALMPGIGAIWRAALAGGRFDVLRAQGVLPIIRRIVVEGRDGPFSAHVPIECEGTWRLAREPGGERLFLNMWLEARAPHASTLGPAPAPDAERALVGRVFLEHVVTRPFAPPSERKVTRLDIPGLPAVPEDEHAFEGAEDVVAGRELVGAGDRVFGAMHTDSNQHVNSLVYPRLFEEAVVRALSERRVAGAEAMLARAVELRYRKPFFRGERATVALEVDAVEGGAMAAGAFFPASGGGASGADAAFRREKPSCAVAMRLG